MQGIQKQKCISCGTMFMSETGIATCPSCSQQSNTHREDESSMGGLSGGCGCGHGH